MSFIGSKPSQTLATPTSQYFNGTGSQTVFTLNRAVNVAEDLEVFVNNIQQEPGVGKSYTAVGTTLTFDAAPSSGTANVYVVYRGLAEVTTRLEHDPNAALAATTGTFSGAFTSPGIDDNATSTAMTLDANSNVGIGNSAPYDVRVHISGDQNDEDPVLGSPTGALIVSNTDTAYGLQTGVSSDGHGWIQQGRVDGTATAYNLHLQPVGGNVGIGCTPSTVLDVEGSNINFAAGENGILNVFSNDAAATDKGGSISLGGNSDSGAFGFALIKGAKEGTDSGYLAFGTRTAAAYSTERWRINSAGHLVPAQLNNGIILGSTASIASNLLNDYEVGTWTGTLKGLASDPTTPVTATGTYTKIGRMVHAEIKFSNISNVGASGNAFVNGIPFTPAVSYASSGNCAAYLFDFPTGLTSLSAQVSTTALYPYVSGDSTTWDGLKHAPGTARYLEISASYITT